MTDEEVSKIISKVLRREFKDLGFRSAVVTSDADFDGSPIIRATARLEGGRAPADRLAKALHDIRSELVRKGDNRFVFLSSAQPKDEFVDEEIG